MRKLLPLLPLILTLSNSLHAAPSTLLESEIQVPLENATGFALIDRTTGQVRIVTVDASNKVSPAAPVHTGLPDVTGATSGFDDGGDEALVLASASANRLAHFNTATGSATPLFTAEPGPAHPAYLRKTGIDPQDLHIAHTFNSDGDTLSLYREPGGAFTKLDDIGGFGAVPSFQPLFDTIAGSRSAVGVANDGLNTRLFYISPNDIITSAFHDVVPEDTLLTTNVRRTDNLLMAVGYQFGEMAVTIIPVSAPPVLDPVAFDGVPFAVGSVAPAAGGTGGILVTAKNGSTAAHYHINGSNKLVLIQTFAPPTGDPIQGLVPVPGRGIMLLSGPSGQPATDFEFRVWNGGGWDPKDQGGFPALVPATPTFATLFWFSAEPLVDPSAQLLDLIVNPDWTSKSDPNPIPVKIFTESYSASGPGLDNPVSSVPSPPAGATHLVTNQFIDSVSLAALGDVLALTLPTLNVTPATGTYPNSITAVASFDDDMIEAFYRRDEFGAIWQPYTEAVPVSYTSTWQFYARDIASGTLGPIVSRTYSFTISDFATFDTDGDGVPDFVEIANGLDPNSGADSDADGFTDLDELLDGSDPSDPASTPGSPSYPFTGEGFRLLAQANNTGAGIASDGDVAVSTDGEPIDLHSMTSSLLGSAPVEPLATPASLAGQLAADLRIGTPVPEREWLILNSPQFFNLDGGSPETRGGREIYKVIQRPVQAPPTIAPTLSGTDLDTDSAAWLAAAAAAYAGYEQVSAITQLEPIDTALTILCEAALLDALGNLSPTAQTTLGVPQDIPADPGPPALDAIPDYQQFTLIGNRDGDSARTAFSAAMRNVLVTDGLSAEELLATLEAAVTGSSPSLNTLTNALYNYHVAHSEPTAAPVNVLPLLPLPLDVLRRLARGGDLPADYAGVVSAATVNVAKVEMSNALALLGTAYRPTATWTVEVTGAVINGESYAYQNLATSIPAAFYEPDGDRMALDRGLGLALGTRFSVTGYTDVTGPVGHDAMEIISLNVAFVPAASDHDTDGNLLDDEWEEFFFGATGVVDPWDTHPINGYSFLQLFLIGHDPRHDCTEIPSEPIVDLAPDNITIILLGNGNLALSFTFPDAYSNLFEFTASQSTDLTSFTPFITSVLTNPGTNTYNLDLGPTASLPDRNFFHLLMSLK